MDIGTEKPAIIVEPIRDPFEREAPSSPPEPTPAPEREPEEVPAGG